MNIIDVVSRFAIPPQYPLNANFRVARPLAGSLYQDVVKHQLHAGPPNRFTVRGTVENHILHRLAAQRGCPRFTQNPAHCVDDIGFAAAIGAHNPDQIARKGNLCGIDKGFEAGEFDVGETQFVVRNQL